MTNSFRKIKQSFQITLLFFSFSNIYSQETPLGSKIVGNGDGANYYIGHFPVTGSDGLDLHWYGGIRFGDRTGNSVMQITNGYVGIGSTNPLFKLDINGVLNVTSENNGGGIRFNSAANGQSDSRNWYVSSDGYAYGDLVFKSSSTFNSIPNETKLIIKSNGNVGIGSTNPLFKLDINGVLNVTSENNGGGIRFNSAANGQSGSRNWYVSSDGYAYGDLVFKSSSTFNSIRNETRLIIKSNGNIGIGTSTPDEKLTVKGKIHAQEVRVDMTGSLVPDYVFANDYKLKTLQEVEAYIKQNSHLPEIPSAQEIEKNGLMLAEMNIALLKKMEEMTLYMIEQEKRLNAQSTEISALKNLEKRLSKLEKNGIKE